MKHNVDTTGLFSMKDGIFTANPMFQLHFSSTNSPKTNDRNTNQLEATFVGSVRILLHWCLLAILISGDSDCIFNSGPFLVAHLKVY
jgi:hypothetical protein